MLYILTVYKDNSHKDITNVYDITTHETLDDAIEYYESQYDLPYKIEKTYEYEIHDLNPSKDDNITNENVYYWVVPDCEEWTDYYCPYETLSIAKAHAKECVNIEHCDVYIRKTFKKIIKKG